MGGLFVVLWVWLFKNEISDWLSDAVAEGIRRSKKEK
jgi:hypothetical protein